MAIIGDKYTAEPIPASTQRTQLISRLARKKKDSDRFSTPYGRWAPRQITARGAQQSHAPIRWAPRVSDPQGRLVASRAPYSLAVGEGGTWERG
jgi:hypothetical protein